MIQPQEKKPLQLLATDFLGLRTSMGLSHGIGTAERVGELLAAETAA